MTKHPTEDLGLYALGFLDRRESEGIDRHVTTCHSCRAELTAHQSTAPPLSSER